MRLRRPAWIFACLALCLAALAWADVPVPALSARVTDLTATLSIQQRAALESELQGLEGRSGSQLAVLLIPSTGPESIEQFSMRVAEKWKLGRQGKDDGLLLLVAKDDRRVRIEVGYGLEGTIPDAVAKRVIDETIAPRFKAGDFAGGIAAGVERLSALIEGGAGQEQAGQCPAPEGPAGSVPKPSMAWPVMDLTATLPDQQAMALAKELDDFYASGRAKPVFVLLVPSTRPEPIADYAARILQTWGAEDNLDVDRSLLLVVAKDEHAAHVEAGAGLRQRMRPGAAESLLAEIEPQLRREEWGGAIQAGVRGLEKIVDDAIANKTFEERVIDELATVPVWLLVALALVGSGIRWFLGPLFGALVMAGAVGAGAWFVSSEVEVALAGAAVAFIFFLVGLANWLAMVLDGAFGGSGGSSGGGFGGGGGGFGGGGASGSW